MLETNEQTIDPEMEDSKKTMKVSLPLDLVRNLETDYIGRCLIGLIFGLCHPPLEILKEWVEETWGPIEAQVETVQVLP